MMVGNSGGSLPRRRICELVTRYELEPNLRDLFVEGSRDQSVYNWYFRQSGCRNVGVFPVASIDVTPETLNAHGLGSGNRARLTAVALELDRQFTSVLQFVRCVADSDFDFILRSQTLASHLLYTDYTSMDLYAYEEEVLRKVLCLGFAAPETEIEPLLVSMTRVLRQLFIIRAANERLNWGMTLLPFTRCCEIPGAQIIFERNEFVERCLVSCL